MLSLRFLVLLGSILGSTSAKAYDRRQDAGSDTCPYSTITVTAAVSSGLIVTVTETVTPSLVFVTTGASVSTITSTISMCSLSSGSSSAAASIQASSSSSIVSSSSAIRSSSSSEYSSSPAAASSSLSSSSSVGPSTSSSAVASSTESSSSSASPSASASSSGSSSSSSDSSSSPASSTASTSEAASSSSSLSSSSESSTSSSQTAAAQSTSNSASSSSTSQATSSSLSSSAQASSSSAAISTTQGASSSSSSSSIASSSSSSSSVPVQPTAVVYTTIVSDVTQLSTVNVVQTIVSTQEVDEVLTTVEQDVTQVSTIQAEVTQISTVNSVVTNVIVQTQYSTAPACSATPTIINGDFESSTLSDWTIVTPVTGPYTAELDTNVVYHGDQSLELDFPIGSTNSSIISISQSFTICPGQSYQFSGYTTAGTGDPGICKVWMVAAPESGITKVGSYQRDFDYDSNDTADSWSVFDILFDNTDLTSLSLTLTINAYCSNPNYANTVYIDLVSLGQ